MTTRLEEFRMPSLGADMTAGRLVQWLKAPGDRVTRGDLIAEVDTDKGAIDIEVFTDGVLAKTLVEPGQKVPVGTPLALIERPEAAATPAAAMAAPGPPPDMSPMRRAIANAMAKSKREIPHYYVSTTVDMGPAIEWLANRNRERPPAQRLLPAVLQLKAVASALREFPDLNAWWVDGKPVPQPGIHVGVVISLRGGGLVIPAIHEADRLGLDDLMGALDDVVRRARSGSLRSSELTEGTVSVTSLGDRGVDTVWGVIYPPQVAIVGFGRIVERPWVVDGQVVARPVVTASLSADHRVTDGHRGSLFLARVEQLLLEPDRL
ncbi:MAG TPA: dihydrolipoamide acetyltransferase family protein [Gemmatimonadales bacterium]|nr:dihydrolipoamide acetyltransferase family protein [Gemmatimonadales bacterium]